MHFIHSHLMFLSETYILGIPLPILALVSIIYAGHRLVRYARRPAFTKLPYPPGPQGLPLIGNALDIPTAENWSTYTTWRKDYGDLVHLNAMGQHIMIIQTTEIARDLLELRSANYSDRPQLTMLHDLGGYTWNFALVQYGSRHKIHRQLFQKHFTPTVVHQYHHDIRRHALQFAKELHAAPRNHFELLALLVVRIIMDITYGHDVKDFNDHYVSIAKQSGEFVTESGVPGSFLADIFPTLKYLPDWFPGTGFKAKARMGYDAGHKMRYDPLNLVRKNMESGIARPCIASYLLEMENKESTKVDEEVLANVAGTVYAGGADTALSHMRSLFLAMVLYPKEQKSAQAELDTVLCGRLPTFDDRKDLPYVNAIVSEILRWNPVAPLGLAHRVSIDDHYRGYFIPKGTIMLPNEWAMLHDPQEYPNPLVFDPSRFVPGPGKAIPKDPQDILFGFGRRICPGRHFAVDELWLTAAMTLTLFIIEPIIGGDGKPIIPKEDYKRGLIVHPNPFPAQAVPRVSNFTELINAELGC